MSQPRKRKQKPATEFGWTLWSRKVTNGKTFPWEKKGENSREWLDAIMAKASQRHPSFEWLVLAPGESPNTCQF
jgi:hypothetical protein